MDEKDPSDHPLALLANCEENLDHISEPHVLHFEQRDPFGSIFTSLYSGFNFREEAIFLCETE